MKLISYLKDEHEQLAVLHNGLVYDMDTLHPDLPTSMNMFLQYWDEYLELAQASVKALQEGRLMPGNVVPIEQVQLLAPVPMPPSCRDGYAFRQHVEAARRNRKVDMIAEFDQYPIFYFTNHHSIQGPGDVRCMPDHFEELDFEFMVDGELFDKLIYLVDGIYPPLTRFLSSESDPHTKLAFSFAQDQEAFRKDVERGFGVLKLKFLSLLHPINLHHKDDIYYLVLACILMHNMMVEARVENEEEESAYLYNTLSATEGQTAAGDLVDDSEEMEALMTEVEEDVMDMNMKHQIVMRRWGTLYDCGGAQILKKAMMRCSRKPVGLPM